MEKHAPAEIYEQLKMKHNTVKRNLDAAERELEKAARARNGARAGLKGVKKRPAAARAQLRLIYNQRDGEYAHALTARDEQRRAYKAALHALQSFEEQHPDVAEASVAEVPAPVEPVDVPAPAASPVSGAAATVAPCRVYSAVLVYATKDERDEIEALQNKITILTAQAHRQNASVAYHRGTAATTPDELHASSSRARVAALSQQLSETVAERSALRARLFTVYAAVQARHRQGKKERANAWRAASEAKKAATALKRAGKAANTAVPRAGDDLPERDSGVSGQPYRKRQGFEANRDEAVLHWMSIPEHYTCVLELVSRLRVLQDKIVGGKVSVEDSRAYPDFYHIIGHAADKCINLAHAFASAHQAMKRCGKEAQVAVERDMITKARL